MTDDTREMLRLLGVEALPNVAVRDPDLERLEADIAALDYMLDVRQCADCGYFSRDARPCLDCGKVTCLGCAEREDAPPCCEVLPLRTT